MTRILIVANGEWPKAFDIHQERIAYDSIVALDGAANRMVDGNFIPDVIIGDFDSLDPSVRSRCESEAAQIIHRPNQEKSDIAKGLLWVEQAYRNSLVEIIGVEGRYDHLIAAYSALFECLSSAVILLDGWTARRIDSIPMNIEVKQNTIISLIAFGQVEGVTLEGCQYPLLNASLSTGTQGVSNKAIESTIVASAESGDLLLFIQG